MGVITYPCHEFITGLANPCQLEWRRGDNEISLILLTNWGLNKFAVNWHTAFNCIFNEGFPFLFQIQIW